MNLPLPLLLDSALRSAILGLLVWFLLSLARLRDVRAEILIWTVVLLAALAMPLLRLEVPAGPALPLPQWAVHSSIMAAPASGMARNLPLLAGKSMEIAMVTGSAALPAISLAQLLRALYVLVVIFQLVRLITGLILTARLYRGASPVTEAWAKGRAIRASAAVRGPISFGRCILLPADYASWSHTKLDAVLAHEESHVGRGDFFIQLLAALYRAVFWFSPFAWWLQARLCALGEAASDEAAIQRLNDPETYAEILVDVSRHANSLAIPVAMAKGPDINWRVDRILFANRERRLGAMARATAVAAILPVTLAVAGAHAAVPPATGSLPRYMTMPVNQTTIAEVVHDTAPTPAPRPARTSPSRHIRQIDDQEPDVTYDPRALLNAPAVAVIPALVPLSDKTHRKNQENAAFVIGSSIYVSGN
ncbi:MAG TPA: M56 family metallopeptidase [Rhizomicrobium sp.]|nr:M56 family metallopeptidase [Rhizomicrobium sp.]